MRGKQKITFDQAAEILGVKYYRVYGMVLKEDKLPLAGKKPYRVYREDVEALKQARERGKAGGTYVGHKIGPAHDFRVFVDPDDDSGLLHTWLISAAAFHDLMTGRREWKEISPQEIFCESVGEKLSAYKTVMEG